MHLLLLGLFTESSCSGKSLFWSFSHSYYPLAPYSSSNLATTAPASTATVPVASSVTTIAPAPLSALAFPFAAFASASATTSLLSDTQDGVARRPRISCQLIWRKAGVNVVEHKQQYQRNAEELGLHCRRTASDQQSIGCYTRNNGPLHPNHAL